MHKRDRLFKETLVRYGRDEMAGVIRLLEDGHTGLAEKHTVEKLVTYIRDLENRLGINVPNVKSIKELPIKSNMLRITKGGMTYYEAK